MAGASKWQVVKDKMNEIGQRKINVRMTSGADEAELMVDPHVTISYVLSEAMRTFEKHDLVALAQVTRQNSSLAILYFK